MRMRGLVVGGTRGLGRALADAWVQEGWDVTVLASRLPPAKGRIPGARYAAADAMDRRALGKALSGRFDAAALFQRWRGKGGDWEGELGTGLTAAKNAIELLAGRLNKGGAIAIAGSPAGRFIASEASVGYHVAKAGQEQLVRYYAALLGPRGLRVNGVSPSTVEKDENRDFFRRNKKLKNLYESIIPLRRLGTAREVAAAVSFLCGPQASFITGQNIVMDGGLSLLWHESLARKLAL